MKQELKINKEILQFKDENILKQVNTILCSHLLTTYKKEHLISEKNKSNFKRLIQLYSEKHDEAAKILNNIGNLYSLLNDHYDKLTQEFKETVRQDGLKLMNEKNEEL